MARSNTTRRSAILNALAEKFKEIDGSGSFKARLDGNVETRMKFWDEIEQYPAVHMAAGAETREYYGGGQKWRFRSICWRQFKYNQCIQLPIKVITLTVAKMGVDNGKVNLK